MSDDDHIHGELGDVIKRLAQEVADGLMTPENLAEVMSAMAGTNGQELHDVSIPFRLALIAQGQEEIALKLGSIKMGLTGAGAVFQYGLSGHDKVDADWLDSLGPEINRAFLQASVWVLRAGYIDASICSEGEHLQIHGSLRGPSDDQPDVEALVSEFVQELDREFPDVPEAPKREGTWW